MNTTTQSLNKKTTLFYAVELISVIALTVTEGFSGLMWLAVAISFVGLIPRIMPSDFSAKTGQLIIQICLILSSALWGYIIMYYLNTAPIVYTAMLIARIITTIIAFKEIRDHMIVVIPLLIGFALLKQAGCIPPIAF